MDKEIRPLVLFGVHAVMEKIREAPQEIAELLLAKGHVRGALRSVYAEATRRGLKVRFVEVGELTRQAESDKHQGIVAKVAPYAYASFPDLIQELARSMRCEPIVLLDCVLDPRNLGALLRSIEGAGIRDVVIPKDRSVGVTSTVVRASSGAAHYLRIHRVTNLRGAITALKQNGFWVVGLVPGAAESVYDRAYPERVAVVLGGEGAGIRPLILRECDFVVSIPMLGKVGSLNVSVAGAVFLYELLRQRRPTGPESVSDRVKC
ncbi:MAG: 23S rRNA (guanosine(2251)-2'-O)-methyltransferase RlmB [Deltaproteobacteria bacterium]|nr:23S rRNA (guanosine(2251)-2'-O)-methyltransferase RlmB [Deltaproteobacteria bacterium]